MTSFRQCIVCGAIYLEGEEVECGHNTVIISCSDEEMEEIKKKLKRQKAFRRDASV